MNLYNSIDLARKFNSGDRLVESIADQQAHQPDKTALALDVAKHLNEARPAEDKPVQLAAMPLPN